MQSGRAAHRIGEIDACQEQGYTRPGSYSFQGVLAVSPYTLGVDFGTNSVRAIVVKCADGVELGAGVFDYPNGQPSSEPKHQTS